ncbi:MULTISPECIES: dienelactone hydrolase family protein [unclassified Burkholderia]|uniref:dienelactone hydrolase family protein n=1 Tax=unclassified Burkholderia TaxID=2613784 RepID=UPI001FC8E386|nr:MULTISPECIES: dienelactone hydrolase family protein [unclassified Burkholderia]
MLVVGKRNTWFCHLLSIASMFLVVGLPGVVFAQVARMEVIPFQSTTMPDEEFLSGYDSGKPVTVAGELRLPRGGSDRFPAVILLHGSGGVSGYVTDWEQEFLAMGVATFVIDSYSGRGIVNTNNDESQLGRLVETEDAYRALALLSKHPRIDPDRIMLMGFSRGAQAALVAGLKRIQRAHAALSSSEFVAYVALYPNCSWTYLDEANVADRPIRVFQGGADDYVAACRAYVARVKASGKDIQFTEYPGAGHLFDWRALKQPMTLPQAQSTRNCQLEEVDGGQIINAKTKQPFTYSDPCVERGYTLSYNEKASFEARNAVRSLVIEVLKPH